MIRKVKRGKPWLAWMSSTARCIAIAFIGAVLLATASVRVQAEERAEQEPESSESRQLSARSVQAALMSFADRFVSRFGQAARELEEQTSDPTLNLRATGALFTIVPAIEIAAQPSTSGALLDMIVFVTLNRMVWESYWYPVHFKKIDRAPLDALESLEAQIWALASQVLTADQIREFRELIGEWRAQNPDQLYVNWVRFSDFKSLGHKPALEQVRGSGGFLAPISDAAATVERARETGERAIYLLTRMQLIASLQVEHAVKQVTSRPELAQALEQVAGLRVATERFVETVDRTPPQLINRTEKALLGAIERLSTERKDALAQSFNGIAREREIAMRQISQDLDHQRESLMTQVTEERQAAIQQLLAGIAREQTLIMEEFDRSLLASVRLGEVEFERGLDYFFKLALILAAVAVFTIGTYRYAAARLVPAGHAWVFPLGLIISVAAALYWQASTQRYQGVNEVSASARTARVVPSPRASSAPTSGAATRNPHAAPSQSEHGESNIAATTTTRAVAMGKPGVLPPESQQPYESKSKAASAPAPPAAANVPASRYPPSGITAGGSKTAGTTESNAMVATLADDPGLVATPMERENTTSRAGSALARISNGRRDAPQASSTVILAAYTVQVGSHRSAADAQRHLRSLVRLGVDARVQTVVLPNRGTYHRILIGRYTNRGQARRALGRLLQRRVVTAAFVQRVAESSRDAS